MSRPCSKLNSKVIRDKAECHIIAAIEKTGSVLSFKCVWRVNDDRIQRAWNWISEKRDDCDLTLSKLSKVCFFFSNKYFKSRSLNQKDEKKATTRTKNLRSTLRRFHRQKNKFHHRFLIGWLLKLIMVPR